MGFKSTQYNQNTNAITNFLSGKSVGFSARNSEGRFSSGLIQAYGGTELVLGDYKVHIFTSTDNFTVTSAPSLSSLQYLIVAGGGASNPAPAGSGGGAGGFVTGTTSAGYIGVGTHLITVGGGGSPSYIFSPSVVPTRTPGTITEEAIRGGDSGTNPGGSGGGGQAGGPSFPYPGGNGTPGQGNPGGTGYDSGPAYYERAGGGGGGAGGSGGDAYVANGSPGAGYPAYRKGGDGGVGRAAFGGWTDIPSSYGETHPNPAEGGRWFAGGGAGIDNPRSPTHPIYDGQTGNGGGVGGGGDSASTPGVVNTGGGAGASPTSSIGGSGIVMIRYLITGSYDYPVL